MSIDCQFPHDAADRLFRAMQRAERDLHRSAPSALKWAARTLVGSLSAATKISAKKRPISRISKHTFEITSWKGGQKHMFQQHGKNIAEIRQRKCVKIGQSGFAKLVWRFLGAAFGGGSDKANAFAKRFGRVDFAFSGANPSIKITNDTGYAASALRNGESGVNAAIAKAAIRLEKSIDAKLAKIAGDKR